MNGSLSIVQTDQQQVGNSTGWDFNSNKTIIQPIFVISNSCGHIATMGVKGLKVDTESAAVRPTRHSRRDTADAQWQFKGGAAEQSGSHHQSSLRTIIVLKLLMFYITTVSPSTARGRRVGVIVTITCHIGSDVGRGQL